MRNTKNKKKKYCFDQLTHPQLMSWWRKMVAAPRPDHEQLLEMHLSLSLDELFMFDNDPAGCFMHLNERLEDAGALNLELPLPIWMAFDDNK